MSTPAEKDIEFLQFLFESTKAGKVDWQPAAEHNLFVTTMQGKYRIFLATTSSGYPYLELMDDQDQSLIKVYVGELSLVGDLFEFVRRKALKVDSVLDNLMGRGWKT